MASNPTLLAEIKEDINHLNDKLDTLIDGSSTTTILRGNLREEIWFCSGQIDAYAKLGALASTDRQQLDKQLSQLLVEMKAGDIS
ncbi:MAG TPA: hypothetical protein VNI53_01690 [Gammaproteobacteria bacterium]|nr:hypothetical protein [Gammaproteobacteria bacterium]